MVEEEENDEYDWEVWDPRGISFKNHMIAGICAGLSEHCLFFPIDTIRTNLQAFNVDAAHEELHFRRKRGIRYFPENRRLLRRIVANQRKIKLNYINESLKKDGIRILWRGILPAICACIPAHALYFPVYEYTKRSLSSKDGKVRFYASALAGSAASLVHDAVMTPLDVLKQRIQLGIYPNTRTALTSVIRNEGVRALYSSYGTTLLMNLPSATILVAINDALKNWLNPDGRQNIPVFLVCGFVGGATGACIACPIDVVKTRIQTQQIGVHQPEVVLKEATATATATVSSTTPSSQANGNVAARVLKNDGSRKYSSFLQTTMKIYKEEGINAFFSGMKMRIFQQAPAAAVTWSVYETLKRVLPKEW